MGYAVRLFVLLAAIFASPTLLHSQQSAPLSIGDKVPDFQATTILNYSDGPATLSSLQKDFTVIDFFGTWCLPCMRALPELRQLQEKNPDQLRILLLSIEDQSQLKKFIEKKTAGSLPLIVDEAEKISALFQPASYPYTVVIDRDRKIVAIETGGLTEDQLNSIMAGNKDVANSNVQPGNSTNTFRVERSKNPLVKLSQDFIYAIKTQSPADDIWKDLASIQLDSLIAALDTDAEKKAFWINIYNGSTQAMLQKDATQYRNRNRFFKRKQIDVAGQQLSLDKIEHGFLRHSSVKWSLGHLHKWFPSAKEKSLRVNHVDYRIHFALNCGAKSCPPIAFYQPASIDQQLDLATGNYLRNEVSYDSTKNTVFLPAIMSWFRGDFGGKKGMRTILKKYNLIPANSDPKIRFKKYDWTLDLSNYSK